MQKSYALNVVGKVICVKIALGDVRVKNVAMAQTRECARQDPQLAKGIRPTKDLRSFFLQSEKNESLAE